MYQDLLYLMFIEILYLLGKMVTKHRQFHFSHTETQHSYVLINSISSKYVSGKLG
jgi:hypothetical protein